MILPALAFPSIDPVLVRLGPIAIHWYALAYIAGIMLGWKLAMRLAAQPPKLVEPALFDDYMLWATLGIVVGGRLGYVIFYQPGYFFAHPLEIPAVWNGGMAFHGGILGVMVATVWFARKRGVPLLALGDLVAAVAPIGLFFGRIANFINGELWGRVTDHPWGMVFPKGGPLPRHPSQLYQAAMEGLILFAVMMILVRLGARNKPGTLIGSFLIGYGVARIIGELFREPDAFLGFLVGGLTMGQILSLPMIAVGATFLAIARRRHG